MEDYVVRLVVPSIALISGLIATYVSLQNRALLAEVRKELAELENRIILRINGTYVRTSECRLRDENLQERIRVIADEVRREVGRNTR